MSTTTKVELDRESKPVRVFHRTTSGTSWVHAADATTRAGCDVCRKEGAR